MPNKTYVITIKNKQLAGDRPLVRWSIEPEWLDLPSGAINDLLTTRLQQCLEIAIAPADFERIVAALTEQNGSPHLIWNASRRRPSTPTTSTIPSDKQWRERIREKDKKIGDLEAEISQLKEQLQQRQQTVDDSLKKINDEKERSRKMKGDYEAGLEAAQEENHRLKKKLEVAQQTIVTMSDVERKREMQNRARFREQAQESGEIKSSPDNTVWVPPPEL